jgi:hypothetical protein
MLIVLTLIIRWMIMYGKMLDELAWKMYSLWAMLDEYGWKNVLPLFRLTKSINFRICDFSSILAFLNILIIKINN